HISLSTWLRDYLYIPLGGNHGGVWLTARNLMITMLLGGLWHGANWTFVVWGFFHGLLLVLYRFWPRPVKSGLSGEKIQPVLNFVSWLIFFHLTMLGWLLFRAGSLPQAGQMFYDIVAPWQCNREAELLLLKFIAVGLPLWLVQVAQARKGDLMIVFKQHWIVQTVIYAFWAYLIIGWGIMRPEEFIYFQF
ncbi:MAG TPA: MBOAT family O-acyltransferase, partial [Candidatus Bathyarchaeia archaeon]|nr:MBOAT family O-acyltransferase [Candidatus Bathyarchaeia archaeon]